MEAETGPVNHVLRRDLARLRSGRVAVGPNQNGWPCGSANNKHVHFMFFLDPTPPQQAVHFISFYHI